jgi:transcriptional regulator with XRE-family HTH domain
MQTRAERIKLLIEQSGLSYQDLEKYTGIKKSSLQRYASGTTAKIPLDVIEKLSKYFNVSQAYLMGWDEDEKNPPEEPKLSEGERMLVELFRQVPKDQQQLVLQMIEVALKTKR